MRSFLLVAAFLTCFESLSSTSVPDVPMTVEADGIISVMVTVNGHGPFPFLLDTGSSRTAVSSHLAQRLELPVVAKTEVIGVSGREFRPVARLTASIGGSSPVTLLASTVTPDKLHAVARGAYGIIGQDLLMTVNYTLDYKRRRFTLSVPPRGDVSAVELPLQIENGRVVVALPSEGGRAALRLVPDSGATTFVVFDYGAQQPFVMESMSGAMQMGTMTSSQDVPMVRLREVRLKTLTLRDQLSAVVRRANTGGPAIDALLPLRLFAAVAFDMDRRRMIVTPR